MSEKNNEFLKRIRGKYLKEASLSPGKYKFLNVKEKIGRFFRHHKKKMFISMVCLICLVMGIYILALDFITKRQNYPERNVLFRARRLVDISGGNTEKKTKKPDTLSDSYQFNRI